MLDHKAHKDQLDHKEPLDLVPLEQAELQDHKDHKALLEPQEQVVLLDHKDQLDHKVQPEQVLPVPVA